jgi:hypothetical protein
MMEAMLIFEIMGLKLRIEWLRTKSMKFYYSRYLYLLLNNVYRVSAWDKNNKELRSSISNCWTLDWINRALIYPFLGCSMEGPFELMRWINFTSYTVACSFSQLSDLVHLLHLFRPLLSFVPQSLSLFFLILFYNFLPLLLEILGLVWIVIFISLSPSSVL